jgi:dethiobiotin synthase
VSAPHRGLFVTGTDTGVGKTLVSAALMAVLGDAAVYYKPVQTGDDDDTATVARLSGGATLPPGLSLPMPAAPYRAALAAGTTVDLRALVAGARGAGDRLLVAEGAGGVLVPLTARETTCDLIAALRLPALVVARTRLGTLNHTLLTVEALLRRGLSVAGVLLNGPPDETPPSLVDTLHAALPAEVRVVAELPDLAGPEAVTPARLRALANEHITPWIRRWRPA